MKYQTIAGDELRAALQELPAWELRDDRLYRCFQFSDFQDAFAFMTRCALVAEKINHHPDWHNVYNRIEVWLSTHDTGCITDHDLMLARAMDDAKTAS